MRWNKFFYETITSTRFGVFRTLFYSFCFLAWPMTWRPPLATLSHEVFTPRILFGLVDIEAVPSFASLDLALGVSLAFSAAGLLNRTSRLVSAILGLYIFGVKYNYFPVHQSESAMVIALVFFAVAPRGYNFSVDRLVSAMFARNVHYLERDVEVWPIRLMQLIFVFVFCSAGIMKIRTNFHEWATENMVGRTILLSKPGYMNEGSHWPMGLVNATDSVRTFLVSHSHLGHALSVVVVLLEILAPLMFIKKVRLPLAIALVGALVAFRVLMSHSFVFTFAPLALSFFVLDPTLPFQNFIARIRKV
ncbi:hypothetical protein BH10BDE1_BH10BDE1_20930 [soil metagenome]